MDPEVLYDKLVGMSCAEIRDYCVKQGVQGYTQEESSCVLARLFVKETTAQFVSVNGVLSWAYSEDEIELNGLGEPCLPHSKPIPSGLYSFVQKFDRHEFPELVIPVEYE